MATKTTTKKAEPKATTAKTANVNEAPVKNVEVAAETKAAAEEAKKETVKSTATKKTTKKTTATKAAAKKSAAKSAVPANTEVYVQFWGKEVYAKDVVENIKKIWTEELGKKEADLKDLKVYIKPEDNGAHYVFNGEITGFLPL